MKYVVISIPWIADLGNNDFSVGKMHNKSKIIFFSIYLWILVNRHFLIKIVLPCYCFLALFTAQHLFAVMSFRRFNELQKERSFFSSLH